MKSLLTLLMLAVVIPRGSPQGIPGITFEKKVVNIQDVDGDFKRSKGDIVTFEIEIKVVGNIRIINYNFDDFWTPSICFTELEQKWYAKCATCGREREVNKNHPLDNTESWIKIRFKLRAECECTKVTNKAKMQQINATTNQTMGELEDEVDFETEDCPITQGDPHITGWGGNKFDFHGVCDLVLLYNPDFENNLGMQINIRNTKTRLWAYVSTAVIQIGSNTLEVMGGKDGNPYWIDGIRGEESLTVDSSPIMISGYPIKFTKHSPKEREFNIDLGNGEQIIISTWNSYIRVSIKNASNDNFGSSIGLMGSFSKHGVHVARDNRTVIDDLNAFGQEWQVLDSEPMLFHIAEGPQAPKRCEIPSTTEMRRRLGGSKITYEDAQVACARINGEDKDLCIFDVMATNDEDVAGAY